MDSRSNFKISRDKYIKAGLNYIYDLDEFEHASVYDQVSSELDELLDLNEPDVLASRCKHFGVGEASDYINRVIETDAGSVIAGIRHLGNNIQKPFIYIWASFKISAPRDIAQSVVPHFKIFEPKHICYWCRPDCHESKANVMQQRFIARISKMSKGELKLSRIESYYDWYKAEYDKFHLELPEKIDRIQLNSKESMDASLKENLLLFMMEEEERIGLISGETENFMGKPAIYLNEILIAQDHRGKGYAKSLLGSFVNQLNAEYFICDIDSENITSTKTALRSGQRVFSQEVFVEI